MALLHIDDAEAVQSTEPPQTSCRAIWQDAGSPRGSTPAADAKCFEVPEYLFADRLDRWARPGKDPGRARPAWPLAFPHGIDGPGATPYEGGCRFRSGMG